MADCEGDLLIGGMKLQHLHCELEQESHADDSSEWCFSGRLTLTPEDRELLQVGRRYRLELSDGRGGQVIISRLEPADPQHVTAEFLPPQQTPGQPR